MEMPPGPEKFDLILCRNVMIYFERISREKLIKQLERCLGPDHFKVLIEPNERMIGAMRRTFPRKLVM